MSYPNNTAEILGFMGYKVLVDFDYGQGPDGSNVLTWKNTDPSDQYYPDGPLAADVAAYAKPWVVSVKKEEIYLEQEIRSANIPTLSGMKLGFNLPRTVVDLMEETYLNILVPAARRTITESDAPTWHGVLGLRNNRNTLLTNLQVWADDQAKTAEDILAFDVAGWAGWSVARP